MSSILRSLAVVLVLAAGAASVPDATVTAASAPTAWSSTELVGQSDAGDDSPPPAADEGRSTNGIMIALILIGSVFLIGLRAIKRQRDEGRRSRWPPIG